MTELESFFTDRRQKAGKSPENCIRNILTESSEAFNDAYFDYEYRIPVEQDKSIYVNGCICRGDIYRCGGGACRIMKPSIIFDLHQPQRSDMIDTFKCNAKFSLFIGGIEYHNITRVLSLCLTFHKVKACIYLEQPNMPDEIIFSQRQHYFSDKLRRSIVHTMNPTGIYDGELLYAYGMAGRRPKCLNK